MSFGISRSRVCLALVFACAAAPPRWAQAQGTNAAPASPAAPAAVNSAPPRDAIKQLEEELSKALRGLAPKRPAEAPLAPAYQPPVVIVPSQRARDEQERRRNWVFDEFSDQNKDQVKDKAGGSSDDWFKSQQDSNSRQPKKKTALDEFYDRLNQERSGALLPRMSSSPESGFLGRRGTEDPGNRDADLPSGIRESAQRLRELLGGDKRDSAAKAAAEANPLSEFFRSIDKGLSETDARAHKAYMDEYRKVLEGPAPPTLNSFNPLNAANTAAPGGASAYPGALNLAGSLGGSARLPGSSTPGMATATITPRHFEDPSATVLNQWNPLYAPPHFEPPKPAPLAVPQVEVPRRRF